VNRSRRTDIPAENHSTTSSTAPCSHAFVSEPLSMNCQIVTTASPVATITRIPGHHAQKNPQNGPPRLLGPHIEGSLVREHLPELRGDKRAGDQEQNEAEDPEGERALPGRLERAAFTMNNTIATKMTVMSNAFRTRGSIPGAIRSDAIVRSALFTDMRACADGP
jgi:hypothetical protein